MIEPAVPAARWRRANSRAQKKVPFRVMSTTVRQALGDMSSAGTGKLAAALLTSTSGRPNAAVASSKAAAISSGSRMSQPTASTREPSASTDSRPVSRCSGLRLAMTRSAPSRANSAAIAFPRPVPPPVTKTQEPAKVPAGSAELPNGGGSRSPMASVIISSRCSGAPAPRRRLPSSRRSRTTG